MLTAKHEIKDFILKMLNIHLIMLTVNSLNLKSMLPSNNHRCQGDKGGLSKLFPKYILETDAGVWSLVVPKTVYPNPYLNEKGKHGKGCVADDVGCFFFGVCLLNELRDVC